MAAKKGRPPLDPTDRSVSVHVVIPSRAYDAYHARAHGERVTVPELIRRTLIINSWNKKTENR